MSDDVQERWRPVVGYESLYEISDLGRLRSLAHTTTRTDGRVYEYPGQMLEGNLDNLSGYRAFALTRDGVGAHARAHVMVLEAFVGPRPPGLEGCHGNGDPSDNRLVNLRWDTPSSNNYDTVQHGRNRSREKECCPRGHPLVAPNLQPTKLRLGFRECWACNRASSTVYYHRHTHPDLDLDLVAAWHHRRILSGDPPRRRCPVADLCRPAQHALAEIARAATPETSLTPTTPSPTKEN